MNSFQILTDSCCDLPAELVRQLDVTVVPLSVEMEGRSYADGIDMSPKELYDHLRAGKTARTSAVNPEFWASHMDPLLAAGQDLLVIAFSSGLSTTYQSAVIAAGEMAEKYPARRIRVADSLCASLGQGLLVWYACRHRAQGEDLDTVYQWVLDNRLHLCHWFTVDDLMHLKRGGRVSAATAVMGTMLQIKPVLHVDDEGHLINVSKSRGRKASLNALADRMVQTCLPGENDTIFISHGDCLEDAEYVGNLLKERCGVKNVIINYVGAVIGSHTGPGVVALFFLGQQR